MYIPFVGNLAVALGPRDPIVFKGLADKYGKIFSLYIGKRYVYNI